MAASSILWRPERGPQTALLTCPVHEIFYGGARGGGKTDGFLGHWIKHASQYGQNAKGIFFRPTYKQLAAVIRRAKKLFIPLGATYSKSDYMFTFPNGAFLIFAYLETMTDAENIQGHDYSWMAVEEMTLWKTAEPLDLIRGALRSAAGVPCWYLANGNPGGPGHSWVKERYITPSPPMVPFMAALEGGGSVQRVFIPARLEDNKYLANDIQYRNNLKAAGPPWLVKAWLEGDWDIVSGSFLEGVWNPHKHIIKPFNIPPTWSRWRAMDWGYARPYSIGWYAMDFDGNIYRYRELYGRGKGNNVGTREDAKDVAVRIQEIERKERENGIEFRRNPADNSIWTGIGTERCVADYFRQSVNPRLEDNIRWLPADKKKGSRIGGAQEIIIRLNATTEKAGNGFQVMSCCPEWIRTVPALCPDPSHIEDVDTDMEDHCFSGDTEVRTANGIVPIGKLVGTCGKVWSVDGWRGYENCRLTRKTTKTVELRFEDGYVVRCTPEHRFITGAGTWVEAQNMRGVAVLRSFLKQPRSLTGVSAEANIKPQHRHRPVPYFALEDVRPLRCVSVEEGKVEDVYCMTVPDTGVFSLANGLLVSNCWDETRYSLRSRRLAPVPKSRNTGPRPGTMEHLLMDRG